MLFLLALVTGFVLVAHTPPRGKSPLHKDRFGAASFRVALIGDSHSQALWPHLRKDLEALGHTVVLEEARAGWSEKSYLREGHLPGKLRASRPDLVVFELGGNNQDMNGESYQKQAEALVDLAHQVGASVVWFGPPRSNANRAANTARRHEITAEMQALLLPQTGTAWFDSRPFTETGHREDGVHFNRATYTNWAAAMLPRIESAMNRFRREGESAVEL